MPFAINGKVSTDPIDGGITITDEQYASALTGIQSGKVIAIDGGFAVVDPPSPIPAPEPEPPTLKEVKIALKANVDLAAENARLKHITPGYGQAMTYMQKAEEARRYLAETDPVDSDYPLLLAEVAITAPTVAEVAAVVHTAYTQWQKIGAAIEAVRLGTKSAIDAEATIEGAAAVSANVVWPELGGSA